MERELQDSDQPRILNLLSEIANKWRQIGVQLGLSKTFSRIDGSNGDSMHKLMAMVAEWLKGNGDRSTPQALVKALKSNSVGEPKLARRVEEEYRYGKEAGIANDEQASSGLYAQGVPEGQESSMRVRKSALKKTTGRGNPSSQKRAISSAETDGPSSKKRKVARPEDNITFVNPLPDELDDHLLTCPQNILCPYSSETDCREEFPNEDLHTHLRECQEQHLHGALNTIKKLKSTTTELQTRVNKFSADLNKAMEAHESALTTTTELQTQVSRLSSKLEEVEESQECCRPQTPPIILRIREIESELRDLKTSGKDETKSWYTPPFYTHNRGYKLRLCITVVVKARECRKITFSVEPLSGRYDCELICSDCKVEVIATLLPRHRASTIPDYPLKIPQFVLSSRYDNSTYRYYAKTDHIPETILKAIQPRSKNKGEERSLCIEDYCAFDGICILVSEVKFSVRSCYDSLHRLLPDLLKKT